MSKVVIIGAGMAGLSAAIFCARAGYETEVYEKNLVPGGCCSGWKRGEYTIDNCIHWMTGTIKDTVQYNLWKDVGGLGDNIKLIKRDSFCSSELNGQTITLWRDIERTRKEMLELSPEDEKEINRFINSAELGTKLQSPKDNPWDQKNAFNDANLYVTYSEVIKTLIEYKDLSQEQLGMRFKHPLLQKLFSDFMNKDYEAYWLVMAYSFFVCGNGEIPEGGSMGLVYNMVDTLEKAGAKLYLGKPVKQINLSKKKFSIDKEVFDAKASNFYKIAKIVARNADGITLADGTFVPADFIICACDINFTFSHLLKKKYKPKQLENIHKNYKKYPLYSSFQVAFAVEGEMPEVDQLTIQCEPVEVATQTYDRICIKNYRVYGDYIAPKGHTVIQVSLVQYGDDFDFWVRTHSNKDLYQITKKNIADQIMNRIETRFPDYKGKLKILDIWTPYSYAHRNNCYKGAYMRFITTATSTNAFISCDIKFLRNVFLAGHWLRYPGGIPTAVTMGKVAAERIKHLDQTSFAATLSEVGSKVSEAAGEIGAKFSTAAGELGAKVSEAAGEIGSKVSEAAGEISSKMSEAASKVTGQKKSDTEPEHKIQDKTADTEQE